MRSYAHAPRRSAPLRSFAATPLPGARTYARALRCGGRLAGARAAPAPRLGSRASRARPVRARVAPGLPCAATPRLSGRPLRSVVAARSRGLGGRAPLLRHFGGHGGPPRARAARRLVAVGPRPPPRAFARPALVPRAGPGPPGVLGSGIGGWVGGGLWGSVWGPGVPARGRFWPGGPSPACFCSGPHTEPRGGSRRPRTPVGARFSLPSRAPPRVPLRGPG